MSIINHINTSLKDYDISITKVNYPVFTHTITTYDLLFTLEKANGLLYIPIKYLFKYEYIPPRQKVIHSLYENIHKNGVSLSLGNTYFWYMINAYDLCILYMKKDIFNKFLKNHSFITIFVYLLTRLEITKDTIFEVFGQKVKDNIYIKTNPRKTSTNLYYSFMKRLFRAIYHIYNEYRVIISGTYYSWDLELRIHQPLTIDMFKDIVIIPTIDHFDTIRKKKKELDYVYNKLRKCYSIKRTNKIRMNKFTYNIAKNIDTFTELFSYTDSLDIQVDLFKAYLNNLPEYTDGKMLTLELMYRAIQEILDVIVDIKNRYYDIYKQMLDDYVKHYDIYDIIEDRIKHFHYFQNRRFFSRIDNYIDLLKQYISILESYHI